MNYFQLAHTSWSSLWWFPGKKMGYLDGNPMIGVRGTMRDRNKDWLTATRISFVSAVSPLLKSVGNNLIFPECQTLVLKRVTYWSIWQPLEYTSRVDSLRESIVYNECIYSKYDDNRIATTDALMQTSAYALMLCIRNHNKWVDC